MGDAPISGDLTAQRIYRAFGFTDEQAAELVASPEHQAYKRALAEAKAAHAAFVANLEEIAQVISVKLSKEMFE